MKKLTVVFSMMTFSLFASRPDTVWVDGSLSDYSGHDGTTENLAFATIQEGVDAVAGGGTVKVKPGVYATGGRRYYSDANDAKGLFTRVLISTNLTLEATDGKDVTHIVGEHDGGTESSYGMGDNAIRCITARDFPKQSEVVVRGFTIRDGASLSTDESASGKGDYAGGVLGNTADRRIVYVVDCTISNCVARSGGGGAYIRAVRSLLRDDHAFMGAALRSSYAYHCVFRQNGIPAGAASRTMYQTAAVYSSYHVVNCTFVDNDYASASGSKNEANCFLNCLCMADGSGTSLCLPDECQLKVTNSVVIGDSKYTESASSGVIAGDDEPYALISPYEGDYRPVEGGHADGEGDPGALKFIPEAYRDTDFHGNPRKTGEKVDIGAVQGAVSRGCGILWLGSREIQLKDGQATTHAYYVGAAEWPRQVRCYIPPTSMPAYCLGLAGAYSMSRFLGYDNGVTLTLPPAGCVLTGGVTRASRQLYVDPSGDDSLDGSQPLRAGDGVGPMKTLQAAVDKAADYTIVNAAPGEYSEGGSFGAGWSNRVYIAKKVHLRATEGTNASLTVICGKYMPNAPKGDGCMTGSVRCVAMGNVVAAVQGFTLRDGCTSQGNVNADAWRGGGLHAAGQPGPQLLGCILENCWATRGGALYGGWHQRCLVRNCGSAKAGRNTLMRKGVSSSCLYLGNDVGGADWVNTDNAALWNCTFSSDAAGEQSEQNYLGKTATSVDSLFICGKLSEGLTTAWGNVAVDVGQNVPGFTVKTYDEVALREPRGTNPWGYAPKAKSVLFGAGAIGATKEDKIRYARYTVDDFEGLEMVYEIGRPTPGALQHWTHHSLGHGLIFTVR